VSVGGNGCGDLVWKRLGGGSLNYKVGNDSKWERRARGWGCQYNFNFGRKRRV
jgi:hypothetical protein